MSRPIAFGIMVLLFILVSGLGIVLRGDASDAQRAVLFTVGVTAFALSCVLKAEEEVHKEEHRKSREEWRKKFHADREGRP